MQGVYLKWRVQVLYPHKHKSPQTGLVSWAGSENTEEGPQRPQRNTSAQPWYFSGSHFFGIFPDYLYPIPVPVPRAPSSLTHAGSPAYPVWGLFSCINLSTDQEQPTKELEMEQLFSPSSKGINCLEMADPRAL